MMKRENMLDNLNLLWQRPQVLNNSNRNLLRTTLNNRLANEENDDETEQEIISNFV